MIFSEFIIYFLENFPILYIKFSKNVVIFYIIFSNFLFSFLRFFYIIFHNNIFVIKMIDF